MSMSLQSTYTDTVPVGYAGQLDGNQAVSKSTGKNADAVSIPFGTPVAFKPSGATSDIDVTIPANSTDELKGFVFRADSYSRSWTDDNGTHGELDSTGLRVGTLMNIARRGRIYVPCQTGCVPGDRLFISYSAGSTYTAAGQLGNASEASHTLDDTKQGVWDSTASAGNFAWLIFNFDDKA